jgi:4-carboxymuconolactone decarboxylase
MEFEKGWEKLLEVTGTKGARTIERHHQFSPDLCKFIVEFAYGDIYSRPGLDLSKRMIVTITALITQGDCEKELSVHIGSALNAGLSPEEIVEVVLHCIPYIGFPRVMNAMAIVREVFVERGIEYGPGSSAAEAQPAD